MFCKCGGCEACLNAQGYDESRAHHDEQEPEVERPFDVFIDALEAAVRDYDRTKDHLGHGSNSDCIRCAIVSKLPLDARERIERSHRLSKATGKPVDVVRER